MTAVLMLMLREVCAVVVPLPERAMDNGELVPECTMLMLPEKAPAAVGVKVAFIVVLCPADRFAGSVGPLVLNAAPDTLACEMLRLLVALFVSVTVTFALLPTNTVPNATVAGAAVS